MVPVFIALEGAKGVGKSRICHELGQRAVVSGRRSFVLTKEPTPNFNLQNEQVMTGTDLVTAIAQDRRHHVREVVLSALNAGQSVVCDRYLLSSLVFHTIDGVTAEEIWELNAGIPLPDINLVLTVREDELRRRRLTRPTTRLQNKVNIADELERYIDFGHAMERRGTELLTLENNTTNDQANVMSSMMKLVSTA
jgi:dTMP kinase